MTTKIYGVDFEAASTPLAGTETLSIVQGGVTVDCTAQDIADLAGGFVNPMTTAEDLIKGGVAGAPARLAVGTNGQVLTVSSGVVGWATPAAGLTNPMTTAGDIITGGTAGAPQRLGIGSAGQVLTVVGGAPAWAAAGGSTAERIDASWLPIITGGGASTSTGTNAPTAVGAVAQRGVASTNQGTARARVAYQVTTPSTTAVAGVRWTNNIFYRAAGFLYSGGWMISSGGTTSTHRVFCGVRSVTAAPTDVDPSTLVSMCGFGYDAADTNVQFFHNDSSGTATKVSTGIAKPTTNDSAAFFFSISCTPGGNINYTVKEVVSGTTFSGTASTDLPATTDALIVNEYASVGGTSSVIAVDYYGKFFRFGSA